MNAVPPPPTSKPATNSVTTYLRQRPPHEPPQNNHTPKPRTQPLLCQPTRSEPHIAHNSHDRARCPTLTSTSNSNSNEHHSRTNRPATSNPRFQTLLLRSQPHRAMAQLGLCPDVNVDVDVEVEVEVVHHLSLDCRPAPPTTPNRCRAWCRRPDATLPMTVHCHSCTLKFHGCATPTPCH